MATILLIDNDSAMRRLLFSVLAVDHTVLEAADGAEALVLFPLARPDLIIMDAQLPTIAGRDLIAALRALSPQVKIIVQTNIASAGERAALFSAGADCCINRPAALDELTKMIDQLK